MGFYTQLREEGDAAAGRYVEVARRADSAVVTLADPQRLNALSAPLVVQTKAALTELAADPAIRCVVLTGAGRGISAGGDLRMMRRAEDALAADADTTEIWEMTAEDELLAAADRWCAQIASLPPHA